MEIKVNFQIIVYLKYIVLVILLLPKLTYCQNDNSQSNNTELSKKIERIYNLASVIYESYPDNILKYADSIIILSKKTDYKIGIAKSLELKIMYFYNNDDYAQSLKYSFELLSIYSSINYDPGKLYTYLRLFNLFSLIDQDETSLRYLNKAKELSNKINQHFYFGFINYAFGLLYYKKNMLKESLVVTQKALDHFRKGNYTFYEARCLKQLGDIYLKMKYYDQSIISYNMSLSNFRKRYFLSEEGNIYSRLANVYHLKENYPKELEYNKAALKSRMKYNISDLIGSSYINIGKNFLFLNKRDSAENYFNKGLKIFEDKKIDHLLENVYFSFFEFYKNYNANKSFKFYQLYAETHEKLLKLRSKSEIGLLEMNQLIKEQEAKTEILRKENEIQKLQARYKTILLIFLAVLLLLSTLLICYIYIQYIKNKRLKEAFQNLSVKLDSEIQERKLIEERLRASETLHRFMTDHSLDLIIRVNDEYNVTFVSSSSSNIYGYTPEEMMSIPPRSLIHPDSMFSLQEAYNKMVEFKTPTKFSYKTSKKNGDIIWIESHVNPIFDQTTGKVKELISVLRDITTRVEQEEALEESNLQKDLLMKEVHHRAKNNFAVLESLLFMQQLQSPDENLQKILSDLKSRVKTMALIHEQLYRGKSIKMVSFGDYLDNLVNIISGAYQNDPVTVVKDIKECNLIIDIALPLGLIVNEMLTNAFKYAFKGKKSGKIWISLNPFDKNEIESGNSSLWILTVKDNGIGLPPEYDIKKNKSMGSQIIDSLVGQIHGTLKISGKKGTMFEITFSDSEDV